MRKQEFCEKEDASEPEDCLRQHSFQVASLYVLRRHRPALPLAGGP